MRWRYRIDPERGIQEAGEGEAGLQVFVSPTAEEKATLLGECGWDPYDLESALDPDEAARLEVSEAGIFMLWKTPLNFGAKGTRRFDVGSIGVRVSGGSLVFVAQEDQFQFSAREYRGARTAADVLLAFLLHSIRHYVGHLRVIRQVATELEGRLTTAIENEQLLQMFSLAESLVYYGDAIEGNSASLGKLRNAQSRFPVATALLEDIVLENNQAAKQASLYGSVLQGLIDARESIVNNSMNLQLRSLTLINIVFLPLNLIAGIGGMSEWSMMTRNLDWRLSYGIFLVGIGLLGWLTWVVVKRFVQEPGPRRARRRS